VPRKRPSSRGQECGTAAEPGFSDAERSLLRKLSARTGGRSTIGVVLSPAEMECLRKLGGIESAPESPPETGRRPPKRTSDLNISEDEKALLRSVALGEALAESGVPRPRARRTTEIVLSPGEIEFLRRLSGSGSTASRAPSAVRDKLRSGELAAGSGREIALELTRTEAQWLDRLTSERDTFITDAERRARAQLREKLHRAKAERRSRS